MQITQVERNGIFLVAIIILLCVLGGGYYYMAAFSNSTLEEITQNIESRLLEQDSIKQSQLDAKDNQIELLKAQSNALKKERDNISVKLKYSIKPKDKIVAYCKNMKIGRWGMPQECFSELSSGIIDMIQRIIKLSPLKFLASWIISPMRVQAQSSSKRA